MDEPGGAVRRERGPTTGDTSSARSPHLLTVVTPEGVLLEFRAAGVGSRMLALFVDLVIQFMALIALLFAFALLLATVGDAVAIVVFVVALFLVFYGYPAVSETLFDGRTVGKLLLGIRVITAEGGPVTLRHGATRAMLATFDFWLPTPGGLVALTSALVTARSQRLGDLAAGTIVVRRPRTAPAPVFFAPAYGVETLSSVLDTSALRPQHYAVVRDYLLRVGDLDPAHAAALGHDLADRVGALTGTPRPVWLDPPRYLVSVLCAHQTRFRPPATTGGAPAPVSPAGPGPWPQAAPAFVPAPPGVAGWPVTAAALAAMPPPTGPPVVGTGQR